MRVVHGPDQGNRSSGDEPARRSRPGTHAWVAVVLVAGLVACVTAWAPPERSYHRTAPVVDAGELVGAEECETCHEDVSGHAPAPEYHADCEACHGAGEKHWETEEVADIRFPSNEDCAACHGTGHRTLMGWSTSEHERTGVLCNDCHASHNREPQHIRAASAVDKAILRHAGPTTQLCVGCHSDVAASLNLPSHHPIREGMMECTDCHAPHESRRVALGARTEQCTGCHEDHAGPWIFEHEPVAEDCSYCHAPHGSSAIDLLETTEPGVCISCHSLAETGAVHDPWALVTGCTDCHGAIHGSYADPYLRE